MKLETIKMNKKRALLFVLPLILFMSISLISAFAISAPYMQNKEMYMQPGQTANLQFNIQNGGESPSDITIKVGVTEGSEIVELIDSNDIYSIPQGLDANTNIRITIPQDANIGDTYNVKISFSTVVGDVGGAFAFGSSIGQKFTVIIGEKPGSTVEQVDITPEEEISLQPIDLGSPTRIILAIIIGIVLIMIIIGIIYYLKKRKDNLNENPVLDKKKNNLNENPILKKKKPISKRKKKF